jgi:hypothetical protein
LDQLLTLKQQQASVIQAWQSIKHGEEAVKQGRAIIIFTTMTIIFVSVRRQACSGANIGSNVTLSSRLPSSRQFSE